jgi:predicted YcjX-like family ATPase
VFPGDLPADPQRLIGLPAPQSANGADMRFVTFRPPRIALDVPSGEALPLPHIRLDRALEFLLGDRLA